MAMRQFLLLSLGLGILSSCAVVRKESIPMTYSKNIPFSYIEGSFMAVPVTINGSIPQKFIFDTGIGISLISKSLCEKLKCSENGKHTGKRMSGQEVTIPMTSITSLSMGGQELKHVPVGIFDMEALMPGTGIDGFLSLGFFKKFPFTVDYEKQVITFESSESLEKIRSEGVVVQVKPDEQGEAFGIFMPLVLPNNQQISVEVDTGSQALILHERYMKSLGVSATDPKVKRKDGKDETGHMYSRFFTSLSGSVHLPHSPAMKMNSPEVMFQKIIYDGLVGHYFLKQFRVTFDLEKSEMIFRRHQASSEH